MQNFLLKLIFGIFGYKVYIKLNLFIDESIYYKKDSNHTTVSTVCDATQSATQSAERR